MEKICLDESALQAVDDYMDYKRIVGDDDGGQLFTPEKYEEYKRKFLPQRMKNRLYVSVGVPGGIDCKLIGPETQCFCTHRYKQHKTDFEVVPSERPLALPCQVRGCPCSAYQYVPQIGPNPVRCRCKHFPQDHSEASGHLCKKCSSCSGFKSPYTCGCGQPSFAHQTLVETKLERGARGQPTGRDVPYAAMGGLTGFCSLLDGYLALEISDTDQDRENGFQERCSASRIKVTFTKTSSSVRRKRETNKLNTKTTTFVSESIRRTKPCK
ncbi:protein FAM221A [Pseudoliparis swirei]|uniref:protein FAM221A n=1 Tax=Pseudoliparis swirei TaxID=2059687 RepID=UPI0024BDA19A|nr:protein FAM221A [Pseudoliparis swirei]